MGRQAYNALLVLATPLIAFYLALRARRQPEYRHHWGERFGLTFPARPPLPLIWIHAVSVGETRAAEPLIAAMRQAWPGHAILLTHMTPTGRATSLSTPDLLRCYLPYDYPVAVARFLRHYRPEIGILMETEVWPNLVAAARRQRIPLVLANARLSERSLVKSRRYAGLVRDAMQGLTAVLAQTREDAVRLAAVGRREVLVTGNLKFDVALTPRSVALARQFRDLFGGRPVLLAASTRAGEEALILDALARARDWGTVLPADLLLVLVPRHPQRFDEVAQLVRDHGLKVQRRSDAAPVLAPDDGSVSAASANDAPASSSSASSVAPSVQVWLGDSMGEMLAYFGAADLAYIGGSLLPLGGQNLIEACVAGCPVLIGPHTFNFAQASEDALAAGAARRVGDVDELVRVAAALLADPDARADMGRHGRDFAGRHSGATTRTFEVLRGIIDGTTGKIPD